MSVIITKSAKETKKIGFAFVKKIKESKSISTRAFVIALKGNLGSGKTTFIQGLASGLGIKEHVLSPTFLILKQFSIPIKKSTFENLYHIDAYRLKNTEEILELGFEDLVRNPRNLIVIEWADKVKRILPRKIVKIRLENLEKNKRKIIFQKTNV